MSKMADYEVSVQDVISKLEDSTDGVTLKKPEAEALCCALTDAVEFNIKARGAFLDQRKVEALLGCLANLGYPSNLKDRNTGDEDPEVSD